MSVVNQCFQVIGLEYVIEKRLLRGLNKGTCLGWELPTG
jgi:hypothetical protein